MHENHHQISLIILTYTVQTKADKIPIENKFANNKSPKSALSHYNSVHESM